jgi:hypothetical protein
MHQASLSAIAFIAIDILTIFFMKSRGKVGVIHCQAVVNGQVVCLFFDSEKQKC